MAGARQGRVGPVVSWRVFTAACAATAALASCSGESAPSPAEGARPGAGEPADGGSPLSTPATTHPATTVVPVPLPVELAQARDGSDATTLAPDAATTVAPSSSFALRVRARVPEARLVLLDAQDAIVPGSGSAEVDASTFFELAPAAPLRPGANYTLRLEGLAGRTVRDASGRLYEPASFRVVAAGKADRPPREGSPHRRRRAGSGG